MRKGLARVVLALALLISILLCSCEHNVYLPENKTWEVLGKGFGTFSQAISYLMAHMESGSGTPKDLIESDIPWERTIFLLRNVGEGERGEAIVVPESYTGELCINFNSYEYWFYTYLDQFFDIRGGDKVDIINGTTVITEDTPSRTAALYVDVRVVTVDDHLIDDRRKDPQAAMVGENGTLVITSSSGNREDLMLGGVFHVEEGGQLQITEGFVYISDINDINESVPGSLVIDGGKIKCPHIVELIADAAIPEEKRDNVDMDVVHDFVFEWEVIVTPATCHEEGLKNRHYACTHCDATMDESVPIPKLEHHKVWFNDKYYHWADCSLCGDELVGKEAHTFVTVGGITYCTFCGYVQEEGGGVQSGFDVTVENLIPSGYLTASELDPVTNLYTITLTTTNPESEPEHYLWYIDSNQVESVTGTSIQAEYRYESFNVMCIFWNGKGTGSAEITIQ